MAKHVYVFNLDCGRMGELTGLFIAEESDYQKILGKEVYFGEALGKHSEVAAVMAPEHFRCLTVLDHAVDALEAELGETITGYNPIEYYEELDDE